MYWAIPYVGEEIIPYATILKCINMHIHTTILQDSIVMYDETNGT